MPQTKEELICQKQVNMQVLLNVRLFKLFSNILCGLELKENESHEEGIVKNPYQIPGRFSSI